ncbi:MAG: DUF1819 family protein [Victivallales bacterium]|nr:DUF1819 family protein [Victivallales bacterium]
MMNETLKVAEKYRELKDWNTAESFILENNVLQKKTLSTAKRMFKEFKLRVQALDMHELELFINGSYEIQKQMNFLAICKAYSFIKDFTLEVVRNKYLEFNNLLKETDFEIFLEDKSYSHPEIERLKDSTKVKLRNVVFKILDEAGFITDKKSRIITPVLLNKEVKELLLKSNPEFLKIYLLSDGEISKIVKAGR